MLYDIGDTIILRSDLEEGEWIEPVHWLGGLLELDKENTIMKVDPSDQSYQLESHYWVAEEMIDHEATSLLKLEQVVEGIEWGQLQSEFFKLIDKQNETKPAIDFRFDTERQSASPWEDFMEPVDDTLSLTIKFKGAKEYRDKLEELHRHIETVERTIEQLNEMELSIEIED